MDYHSESNARGTEGGGAEMNWRSRWQPSFLATLDVFFRRVPVEDPLAELRARVAKAEDAANTEFENLKSVRQKFDTRTRTLKDVTDDIDAQTKAMKEAFGQ